MPTPKLSTPKLSTPKLSTLKQGRWIVGPCLSGKTHHLLTAFQAWFQAANALQESVLQDLVTQDSAPQDLKLQDLKSQDLKLQDLKLQVGRSRGGIYPRALVLSAIGDNRLILSDRLTTLTESKIPFWSTTPLGFFEEEVLLFWPLLVKKLGITAQFPVRLRPENEQELATRLWRSELEAAMTLGVTGSSPNLGRVPLQKLVRRLLDIYQLAAFSETPLQDIATLLRQGFGPESLELGLEPEAIVQMLCHWRSWCLDRGLLNYGILTELYGQFLLQDPYYQLQLPYRIQAIFADDVDEYPPVMRSVFQTVLNYGAFIVGTFNPNGGIRMGLGADPAVMTEMARNWEHQVLSDRSTGCWAEAGPEILSLIQMPSFFVSSIPNAIQVLQTTTRAELLRQTATLIRDRILAGEIKAQDIAIVAPGFDPISRYALTEMLTGQGIRVRNLNEQRPLATVPLVRSLLTVLALIYPNLGRWVKRDGVAEMLVVLSPQIDPVRSGLLVDYCFQPDFHQPQLRSSQFFPRWDRLGYEGMNAYEDLIAWIATQQAELAAGFIENPMILLDRAIQKFFLGGAHLPVEQIASLRELLDTIQHYWQVEQRLSQSRIIDHTIDRPIDNTNINTNIDKNIDTNVNTNGDVNHHFNGNANNIAVDSAIVGSFIQLLRSGAVNANPYPVQAMGLAQDAVTIATVFQYRLNRESHRWQFWFDAGGSRWLTGGDALFASPLFLRDWSGQVWGPEDTLKMHEQRLERIVRDLLARSGERVILCHSDLATNGQEQLGPLLPIVNAAENVNDSEISMI